MTEPEFDGQVISPYDVHMVAGPFVGPPGAIHVCSDWEIRASTRTRLVWSASCVTGALAVHIHLGDGTFVGALAGHHQLDPDSPYTLLVRFKDGALPPGRSLEPLVEPLLPHRLGLGDRAARPLRRLAACPSRAGRTLAQRDLTLPAGVALRLEIPGTGSLLEFHGPGSADEPLVNPPALSGARHGPRGVRGRRRAARSSGLADRVHGRKRD